MPVIINDRDDLYENVYRLLKLQGMDVDNTENFNRNLMCIEYPGYVKNVDKMLQTLGGIDNIGIAYGTENRRVELRFRPDDVYCKPTCGERFSTIGLILTIKKKKPKTNLDEPCSSKSSVNKHEYAISVVGIVDTIFKFNNLCDFQYLPARSVTTEDSEIKLENIHDKLKPSCLSILPWFNDTEVSLFLTPPVFSRFDTVHYYNNQKVKEIGTVSESTGRIRKPRTIHTKFLHYSDENVPSGPGYDSLKSLKLRFSNDNAYETLKNLFADRPVWSKNALVYITEYSKEKLKYLLPTVAYYFLTGPWRVMWVRFGYDPRKEPEARKYQTFDYRLRHAGGLRNTIKAKRSSSNYLLPYKNSPSSKPKIRIITRHSICKVYKSAAERSSYDERNENSYIFRPGFIPPTRQMFYQYCDICVPEIQSLLARIPMPKPGAKCDSRTGWLPKGFDNRCREMINNLIIAEIRRQVVEKQKKAKRDEMAKDRERIDDDDSDESDDELEFDDEEMKINEEEISISDDDDDSDSVLDFTLDSDDDSNGTSDSDSS